MTDTIHPQLDQFDPSPWVESGLTDDAGAAEAFLEAEPTFYASNKNATRLCHWIKSHNVPFTVRNMQIGMRKLFKAGSLEQRPVEQLAEPAPVDRGVIHIESTIRLPYTAPNNEATRLALDKHLSGLREMSLIGKPIGENLKRAYQESLVRERQVKYTAAQINAAKAHIGLNHPEVKRESLVFSRLVAEFLANAN